MKECLKVGNKVGIFLALLFVLCFAWFWIRPVHQELHMQIMEINFFGFTGMNFSSFIFGVIQSYIWGYIGVFLWHVATGCDCACCKK